MASYFNTPPGPTPSRDRTADRARIASDMAAFLQRPGARVEVLPGIAASAAFPKRVADPAGFDD